MRERKPLKDHALGNEKAVCCLGKRGRHKAEGGQQLPSIPWNQGGRTQGSWQPWKQEISRRRTSNFATILGIRNEPCQGWERQRKGKGHSQISHHKDSSNVVLCYSDSYLSMVRAPVQHFSCFQESWLGE